MGDIAVEPGERVFAELPVCQRPDGTTLGIPVGIINGLGDGPRLLADGGLHGDEYEGPRAIMDVLQTLDPAKVSGTFVGIPIVNVPSYQAKVSLDVSSTRETPHDWKNLNRVLPGNEKGTVTDRLAWTFAQVVLGNVDYALDFHSGGDRGTSIIMAGYVAAEGDYGRKSLAMAEMFPMEVLWKMPPWAAVATAAMEKNVPLAAVECTGEGRCPEDEVELCRVGITNVMKLLEMLPGQPENVPTQRRYIDSETYVYADKGGLLKPLVTTGDPINQGQVLGVCLDVYGRMVEECVSPVTGVVTGVRTKPVVWPGEPVFLTAQLLPEAALSTGTSV
jgi:predicted deacylase